MKVCLNSRCEKKYLQQADEIKVEGAIEDDIQKIIQHSLEIMSEEDKKIVIGHYGDIEEFKESVAESFKDEKACEHFIKIYGSKEKTSLYYTGE